MFVIELTYKAALAEIEELVREDPFVARGLAEFRVVAFRASQRAKELPERIA